MTEQEERDALLARLAARINLDAEAERMPARPTTWYPAEGPTVEYLQRRLEAHGFYAVEQGDPLGVFSRQTEQAVRAFQAAKGLRADAVVGEATWYELDAEPPERPLRTLDQEIGDAP